LSENADRALPKDILLDLLRGAHGGRTAADLVESARLFGHSENVVRVTLSRLQSRGLIESPARGRYRLAAKTDPVNEFVERWRLGEGRVRKWRDGSWLFAHAVGRSDDTEWALDALGFRAIRPDLFARPDNLNLTTAHLRKLATGIGLAPDVLLVAGTPLDEHVDDWMRRWSIPALDKGYASMRKRLVESAARLDRLPRDEAKLESFRLGGAAIRLLAKDPLLPAPFVDVAARTALWREMVAYHAAGMAVWARAGAPAALPFQRLAVTN
jgi:phenylacetic acid degradation operon negative regulatory protein